MDITSQVRLIAKLCSICFPPLALGQRICIAAGLEQAIEYLNELHFAKDDLDYLRSLGLFSEDFLDYLGKLRFTGDVDAVVEGTPIFPNEPIMRITAPIAQAQLIETSLANIINHQTLIATKASRVVSAAEDTGVMEFGLRRAQGLGAGLYGSRAAFIGGCAPPATYWQASCTAFLSRVPKPILGL